LYASRRRDGAQPLRGPEGKDDREGDQPRIAPLSGDGARFHADFDEMTVAELKDYAATNNIDLGDATLKADILKKVKAVQHR
jgi:hypothetical protein